MVSDSHSYLPWQFQQRWAPLNLVRERTSKIRRGFLYLISFFSNGLRGDSLDISRINVYTILLIFAYKIQEFLFFLRHLGPHFHGEKKIHPLGVTFDSSESLNRLVGLRTSDVLGS